MLAYKAAWVEELVRGEEVVVVRIGKKGLTEGVLTELDNVLRARGVVKIKLSKSFREILGVDKGDKSRLAAELAERLGARVVNIRGHTIILRRAARKSTAGRKRGERA